MKTFGAFDEMIEKLIDVAEFFGNQDEPEKKNTVVNLVREMYNEHLELGKHLKETDPYIVSHKWIAEWLNNPTGHSI